MRITLLTILICILVSGCGLFKKTTKKVNSTEYVVKKEESNESSKKESEVSSESSRKKENESSSERDQRDLDSQTSIEADEITIDKNGNVSAKGGAKLTNHSKDKGSSGKDSNKSLESTNNKNIAKVTTEESKGRKEEEIKNKGKESNTVSEPSSKGIIWGAAALTGCVLIFLWYFGIKRKS